MKLISTDTADYYSSRRSNEWIFRLIVSVPVAAILIYFFWKWFIYLSSGMIILLSAYVLFIYLCERNGKKGSTIEAIRCRYEMDKDHSLLRYSPSTDKENVQEDNDQGVFITVSIWLVRLPTNLNNSTASQAH